VDVADELASVVALRDLADRLEGAAVERAMRAGWSWGEVAEALGVTRQAVHKKHSASHHTLGRPRLDRLGPAGEALGRAATPGRHRVAADAPVTPRRHNHEHEAARPADQRSDARSRRIDASCRPPDPFAQAAAGDLTDHVLACDRPRHKKPAAGRKRSSNPRSHLSPLYTLVLVT
jgi:hypothetical protein